MTLKQLFVVSDRERFLPVFCALYGEEKERQPPFLLVVGFEKFRVCVLSFVCCIYIEDVRRIGNREITRDGEKKSFEVGGLND